MALWLRILLYALCLSCAAVLAAVAYGVGDQPTALRIACGICAAVGVICSPGVWRG